MSLLQLFINAISKPPPSEGVLGVIALSDVPTCSATITDAAAYSVELSDAAMSSLELSDALLNPG